MNKNLLVAKRLVAIAKNLILAEAPPTVTTKNGMTVVLSPHVNKHIQSQHAKPGTGSVFAKEFSLSDFSSAIQSLSVDPSSGLYEISVPGAGYDLVTDKSGVADILKKYPSSTESEATKEERGAPVKVKALNVAAPLSAFKSDIVTVVIRPTPADMAKQHMPELTELAEQKKLFSVLSAWPGKSKINGKDIPPASKWGDEYYVIIPMG